MESRYIEAILALLFVSGCICIYLGWGQLTYGGGQAVATNVNIMGGVFIVVGTVLICTAYITYVIDRVSRKR